MNYSSNQAAGKTASVLNFLVTITLAILFFIYITMTVFTKDALWFNPTFEVVPAEISIRCYGEDVLVSRDSKNFSAITDLVNEQISGDKRWDELNLTDQTFQDYETSMTMMILQLHYNEPQRIHSQSPFFSGFTSLLIPLDGRFSDTHIMFAIVRGKPSGGSFHLASFEAVRSYIIDNAICVKP